MASSSRKKTTMAKLNREAAVRERRQRKKIRKDARKQAALDGTLLDDGTSGLDDGTSGLDDTTPGLDDTTPGLDDTTPGLDDTTPGLADATAETRRTD